MDVGAGVGQFGAWLIENVRRRSFKITMCVSTKLYKVNLCYENLLGCMKSSEQVHNEMKTLIIHLLFGLRLYFADF